MKKGFTLIELLAVMVILAVILVIAVPMVLNTIENAKQGAIESDAKLIIDAIEKKAAIDDTFNYEDITKDNIEEKLGIENDNYKSIKVTEVNGEPSILIEGQNKYDGYTVYGNNGDLAVVRSEDYDTSPPTVTFGLNGNNTYSRSRSTTVTVSDPNISTSSLKYQWTTSPTAPTEASFSSTFTSGDSINSPAGVTGSYYLWVLAKDTLEHVTITRSNMFNLDNIVPIIAMSGSSPVTINQGDTYTDAGATASDNIDGSITVQATSTVNSSIVGTYTVTYNVSDTAGNTAISVVRTVNVLSPPPMALYNMYPKVVNSGCYTDSGSCISEIALFPYVFTPSGYSQCDGKLLQVATNVPLFVLIGSTFGGNGTTNFAVPNLTSNAPLTGINYYISTSGIFPSGGGTTPVTNGNYNYYPYQSLSRDYFIGEIRLATSLDEAGSRMLLCDGRLLSIASYPALFSLIGNNFGGNGTTNFALPNLLNAVSPVDRAKYYIAVTGIFPSH